MSITAQDIYNIAPELSPGVQQQQTITFSANLVTLNVISGTVGVGSYSVTFATSNAATLSAIATAISGLPRVASCTSDGIHTLTVVTNGNGIALSVSAPVVTLGASQATATVLQTIAPVPGTVTQAMVNAALNNSLAMINQSVWGGLADEGQAYLAAHLLSLSTLKGKTGVLSQKVGGLSRTFMNRASITDQAYYLTGYGIQYLALRNMLVITPLNTGFPGPFPTFPGPWII